MEATEGLIIRQYKETDRVVVWDLHLMGLNQMGSNIGVGSWDEDLVHIKETYLEDGGEFLIGEYNQQIVAMGAIKKIDLELAEVKRMRVHSGFQGKGFGQAILDKLVLRAKELGYRKLHLDTSVKQVPAQRLYKKNGFREVRRMVIHNLETIFYEKDL